MRLDTIACGPLGVNTYVVSAEDAATCAVIDPGDAAPVLERLRTRGQQCTHILITHGHFDHIWGAASLVEATGAQLAVHELDAAKLQSTRASLALLIGKRLPEAVPDVLLHDGDTLACAGLTFRVIHTPGHSEGGVCYLVESERVIFCGDTVFLDSVGRTDFPGASELTLYRSIAERLFPLEGDYVLYPGHGPETTLDHERAHNPFMGRGRRLRW